MAFSSLIPGAGGSYTLTQGHSFMRMGSVVNTCVHDVSLSVRRDKFGALLCQAVHGPERVVLAWVFAEE